MGNQISQTNPLDTFKSTYDQDDDIVQILVRDRTTLGSLFVKVEKLAWNERLAVGLVAYHRINQTTQLIDIKPRHGEFTAPVAEAMELLKALSPSALAEFAGGILQDDFGLEP